MSRKKILGMKDTEASITLRMSKETKIAVELAAGSLSVKAARYCLDAVMDRLSGNGNEVEAMSPSAMDLTFGEAITLARAGKLNAYMAGEVDEKLEGAQQGAGQEEVEGADQDGREDGAAAEAPDKSKLETREAPVSKIRGPAVGV